MLALLWQYSKLVGYVSCMSMFCFLFSVLSVSAHRHPRVWNSVLYVILFCQQHWTMCWRVDWGWGVEVILVLIQAHVCPPLPLHSLPFLFLFSISSSFSSTTSGSPQEVQRFQKCLPSSSSLVTLSLSQINIEKPPNLTAEWLIQIIVAFSCIMFLWLSSCFSYFPPVQCGIWATSELSPFEQKGRKKRVTERERKEGIQYLSNPVIFCSVSMIACLTGTDKWVNRGLCPPFSCHFVLVTLFVYTCVNISVVSVCLHHLGVPRSATFLNVKGRHLFKGIRLFRTWRTKTHGCVSVF